MITWTTPTLWLRVNSGLLDYTRCNVLMTISQGCRKLTIEPVEISSTLGESLEDGYTNLRFDLSQLETGGFRPGAAKVQVNFIDWMGYRAATKEIYVFIGNNLVRKELDNTWTRTA